MHALKMSLMFFFLLFALYDFWVRITLINPIQYTFQNQNQKHEWILTKTHLENREGLMYVHH